MVKLKISYYIHNLPTRQNNYFNTMNMCNLYQIIIIIMTILLLTKLLIIKLTNIKCHYKYYYSTMI